MITFPGQRITVDTKGVQTTETIGPDPRWGLAVPVTTSAVSVGADRTTDEIFLRVSNTRGATISSPGNPLTLQSQSTAMTANGRTSTVSYAAAGRTVTATDAAGLQTISALDALGRPLTVQTANMAPLQNTYDTHGRLTTTVEGTGGSARTTVLAYNSAGWPASVTDPLGGVTSLTYDAAGRELSQTLPTGQVLTFSYDAAGNLTASTDAQAVRTIYEYDGYNRLAAQTLDPAGRAVRSEYHYDLAGNLTSRVDDAGSGRLNATTRFAYAPSSGPKYVIGAITDPLGQQTSYSYTDFAAIKGRDLIRPSATRQPELRCRGLACDGHVAPGPDHVHGLQQRRPADPGGRPSWRHLRLHL